MVGPHGSRFSERLIDTPVRRGIPCAEPFHPHKMMERRVLGGSPPEVDRQEMAGVAMAALAAGAVRAEPLMTHRFAGREAKQAYDLLYEHPEQALGVLLRWNDA